MVIAVGGRTEISKNSTEIWDPNSDDGWVEGIIYTLQGHPNQNDIFQNIQKF